MYLLILRNLKTFVPIEVLQLNSFSVLSMLMCCYHESEGNYHICQILINVGANHVGDYIQEAKK